MALGDHDIPKRRMLNPMAIRIDRGWLSGWLGFNMRLENGRLMYTVHCRVLRVRAPIISFFPSICTPRLQLSCPIHEIRHFHMQAHPLYTQGCRPTRLSLKNVSAIPPIPSLLLRTWSSNVARRHTYVCPIIAHEIYLIPPQDPPAGHLSLVLLTPLFFIAVGVGLFIVTEISSKRQGRNSPQAPAVSLQH
jgi:hypothetical protein